MPVLDDGTIRFSFCAVLPVGPHTSRGLSPKAIRKAFPKDRAPVRAGIKAFVRPSGHHAADHEFA
jgi:hypothetical protein